MNGSTRKRTLLLAASAVVIAAMSAAAGYRFAGRTPQFMTPDRVGTVAPANTALPANKPLYWYDPMQPNQHFDQPGKSPFMDMQLVPKYADGGADEAGIRIDPTITQNLGIRLAAVERAPLPRSVEAIGSIGFNQRTIAVVQSRTSGFVARVYARAPGDVLKRNAPLVDLWVPEWSGAQIEFLALQKTHDRELITAARQRLVLLGMPADLIAGVEERGEPQTTVTIRAPFAGVIDSLEVHEGMTLAAGGTLAKINGLDTVWLEAAVPEVQAARVPVGGRVAAQVMAYAQESFTGRIIAVLPEANVETRTVRVRIELANPAGRLRPGMFARVRLSSGESAPVLSVASEAVMHTGTRTLVIVAGDGNRFTPTEVQTGEESNGRTVILQGLEEGEQVVASGQFLIDSEASLRGTLARLRGSAESGSAR